MSKKFRLLMVMVLVTGLLGGLLTASTVSADPDTGGVVEIPRIDIGDAFATGTGWDTKIQVQNVGGFAGGAVVFFWEAYSADCPSNAPGPQDHACMQLPEGGIWTLHNQIPDDAKSAIIYSVDWDNFFDACNDASGATGDTEDWLDWVNTWVGQGPDLAVTVDRWGIDPFGEFEISSSYTGVSDPGMIGWANKYFAPYVMHEYNDLDTIITIQNSGNQCTSIWIYYKEEGNCEFMKAQHIELIAPGESITVGPAGFAEVAFPSPEIDGPWLGSAYISANEPLGIIVDQLSLSGENRGTLLSMRGMPYDQQLELTWYADLLYREISGYSSSIQVQNITLASQPTFVTVEFFDQSGDHILYVGEWVCRNGTMTFYLPAIVDLGVNFPFGYVGAAEIQSHGQIDYPGDYHDGEPIFAVVDLKKTKVYDESLPGWRHTVAGETQGGAYNAHPEHQKTNAWGWAMPFIAKEQEGVTSRIVIRNNSNCTKISGNVRIQDETGRDVAVIPVRWLHPKHMKVLDLAYFGQIVRGFVGAAVFEVSNVEQLCDNNWDGETDILPVMPSVVVLNYGYEKELPIGSGAGPQTDEGDLTRIYEAIPFDYSYSPCVINVSGTVIDELTLDPIAGADVSFDGVGDTTDSTGYYDFSVQSSIDPNATLTVVAEHDNYDMESVFLNNLYCRDQVVNFELHGCDTIWVSGYVEDKETGLPVVGAAVEAMNCVDGEVDSTNAYGYYEIALDYDDGCTTWVSVTAEGYNASVDSVFIPCGDEARVDFQVHQSPKSRILLYYGNGGDNKGYNDAKATFENLGYLVDYTNVWPTDPDLEEYKVIFLLGPGNGNGDPTSDNFTPGQVAQLDLFLRNGGRLVVMTEGGLMAFTVTVENNLINALNGLDLAFNQDWINGALADNIMADQITDDAATLDFDSATSITVGAGAVPGELGKLNAPHPYAPAVILAADTMPGITRLSGPGFAGDVVVIGDMDWMDDGSFMGLIEDVDGDGDPDYVWPDWPGDNENLLLNLITF